MARPIRWSSAASLLAVVAVERGRWNLAALALAGPILLKVYPLAIALLLLLVYPRQLGWRLTVVLAVGLLLPFALQDPSYVARQYDAWFVKLLQEDRSERIITETYRDCWLLIRWTHLPLPHRYYLPLQLADGCGRRGGGAGRPAAALAAGRATRAPRSTSAAAG